MSRNSLIYTIVGSIVLLLGVVAAYFYIRHDYIPFIWEKKLLVDSTQQSTLLEDSLLEIDSAQHSISFEPDRPAISDETQRITPSESDVNQSSSDTSIVSGGSDQMASNQPPVETKPMDPKEKKKLVKLYESMPPAKVAEILDLTRDDNKVKEVIMMLNAKYAGKVLQLLPPERVQKIMGLKKEIN